MFGSLTLPADGEAVKACGCSTLHPPYVSECTGDRDARASNLPSRVRLAVSHSIPINRIT
jgi:hypothetical protein